MAESCINTISEGPVLERIPGLPGACIKRGCGAHAERIHAHREHSLSIVRNGATAVRIAGRTLSLAAGQGVYIPPGVPHLCSPKNPESFAFEVLYWTGESNERTSGFGIELSGGAPTPMALRVSEDATGTPARCIETIREFFSGRAKEPDWKMDPVESILSAEACRLAASMGRAGGERYREYRRCRVRYGVSPRELGQNLKIERAKKCISRGMSIADAAAECGFFDQSHFVRAFKLFTGLTPTEFRKAC